MPIICGIPEFPGYGVSDDGRFWSMKRRTTWKENKTHQSNTGYLLAGFLQDGKFTKRLAHRVIASVFIGSVDGFEVNHINGIKTDNRIENLEIVTSSQNTIHAINAGLRHTPKGILHWGAKLTDAQAMEIGRLNGSGIPQWEIANRFSVSQMTVSLIFRRKRRWANLPEEVR